MYSFRFFVQPQKETKLEKLPTFLNLTVVDCLRRFNSGLRGGGRSLEMTTDVREDEWNFYLDFKTADENAALVIPRARTNEFGNIVLGDRFDRALCPSMVVVNGQPQHTTYEELISIFLSCNIEELFPQQGKRNFIDKILYGFEKGRGRLAVSLCQRFLNLNLFNALPLSGTPMQDWAMNRRLMIFDPVFDKLRPDEKLEYQKRKNELLFPWASIGLSDGAAAVKNYILKADLRDYTAFGVRHHNPIRNLYSTLGMKGPEPSFVISESARGLEDQGIVRGGWNWMTVFLDLPLNFEDQILVDKRHAGKTVSYRRSFVIYGEEAVEPGDSILKGRVLGINEDENPVIFDIDCDHAKVLECKDGDVPFDGKDQPVRYVTLEVVYSFKEGFKITNQHGNKGIVRLEDLGTVNVNGVTVPVDVIVSAKSIQKRKNFGQVLEALATVAGPGNERIVVPDDCEVTIEQLQDTLKKSGISEDGTFEVKTPWGTFNTLAGFVHWGVIKTPEEQLWEGRDVWTENQRGLRTRGNKVSTIEIKAMTTLLGSGSKVVQEILSYQQGGEEVRELLRVLDGIRGNYQDMLPLVEPDAFVYVPSGMGTFHDVGRLMGTVADDEMFPQGCYLKLPFALSVQVPLERWKGNILEGIAGKNAYEGEGSRTMEFDRILIPSAALRQPWKHPTGMMGLSDVATQLTQILEMIDRLKFGEVKEEQVSAMVFRYLHMIGRSLSLKTGKISQYLMAVRYPWSSKATASLGSGLEENWVEIHKDMARDLKVETGDYVMVERFPCLGFMSTRIQRVNVTDDPECKYVIRVSQNSLVSMNLDFDGDVIYIMSFRTDGARMELAKNFHTPHPRIKEVLDRMNGKKIPMTRTMSLPELDFTSFDDMTPEEHADLNATALAAKLWTGPTIALCYNLMRIVEGNISYDDRDAHINVEVFLDKVGNSVFQQKHGTKSLREECIEAVCLADADALIKLGFPTKETYQLCQIIREYASKLGVKGDEALRLHYQRHLEEGKSNIINTIVRRYHRQYFATRAQLHPIDLLEHLETEPSDLVGHLIRQGLESDQTCQRLEAAV
jgi:hypothetical protein